MTSLTEFNYDILQIILTSPNNTVNTIGRICCVSRYFRDVINHQVNTLINVYLDRKFPYFRKLLKVEDIKYSDINLNKLVDLLEKLHRVSQLKKGAKYQYLLVGCYNSSLFRIVGDEFIIKGENINLLEARTLSILTTLFNYVKLVLPKNKTDLDIWVLYPLFEYGILCMEDQNRQDDTLFVDGFILRDKAREIRHQLNYTNASTDIKYRLMKLLNYIDPELSSDDDADY